MSDSVAGPAAPVELSLILPCYNAASLLEGSVSALMAYLEGLGVGWEIVLVDDGSTDGTPAVLARLAGPRVRTLRLEPNRGKGRAVREGMLAAAGRARLFTDADLPYRLDSIAACLDQIQAGRDAVFGSRLLAGSTIEADLPLLRRLASGLFRLAAGTIIGRYDLDTQCGFKGFSGPLADRLFPLLTIDRFAFDVELCLLLAEAGVPIGLIPVQLVNQELTTVTFVSAGLQTAVELGRIGLRRLRRGYDLHTLHAFAAPAA